MDASMYTARLRAVMAYTNARDLSPSKGARFGTNIATKHEGEILNFLVETPPPQEQPPQQPQRPFMLPSAIEIVNNALYDIMKYIQTLNPGPTRASRLIYLWFVSITATYNWVSPTAHTHISGIKDGWNWSTRHVIPANVSNTIYSWITYALTQIMPVFLGNTYAADSLLAMERTALRITAEEQSLRHATVAQTGHWSEFWTAWQAWYNNRITTDGAATAAIPPTEAELPNGAAVVDTTLSTPNPATFPAPQKWTPLKIGTKTQKYLTYNWNSVRSSCLTADDEHVIKTAALTHLVTDATARAAEIHEIVEITNNLTDEQKMVAEFWAGGPGTVSPPCIAVVMWNLFMKGLLETQIVHYDTYFFSGMEMAIHVFEAGRLIWGLKKQVMQARPIQEIRATYRGKMLKNGFGETVQGELWTPFQESNFVTPPFADFPSGHSGFSQVFAEVMTKWFGAEIPKTMPTILSAAGLDLISPVLDTSSSPSRQFEFPTFIMSTGSSRIQPGGIVPATDVILTWKRWQDMADSAGISRKYGGIHATSAHTGSQELGKVLYSHIQNRWSIKK